MKEKNKKIYSMTLDPHSENFLLDFFHSIDFAYFAPLLGDSTYTKKITVTRELLNKKNISLPEARILSQEINAQANKAFIEFVLQQLPVKEINSQAVDTEIDTFEKIYSILQKKRAFESLGSQDNNIEEHKHCCDLLTTLPHEFLLSVIKHAQGPFSPTTKDIIISLDLGELYSMMTSYKKLTCSYKPDITAKAVYAIFKTKKSPEDILDFMNTTYGKECDFLISIEQAQEEETQYIHFSNSEVEE